MAVRGLLLQEDAALRVVDVGELVEQREPLDGVGVRDDLQVRVQGVGIAANVDDPVELLRQLDGGVVQPRPRRVHQDGPEVVLAEVDALLLQVLQRAVDRQRRSNRSARGV